ncbi:MAG TPA: hypothetical protein VIH59_10980 [Candidatus Tectomicrobia bacterium]|jgi:hypothetical protein
MDLLSLRYACQCEAGDVWISREHSDWSWVEPAMYRATYVGDAAVEHWRQSSQDDAFNVLSNRNGLENFLRWRRSH